MMAVARKYPLLFDGHHIIHGIPAADAKPLTGGRMMAATH